MGTTALLWLFFFLQLVTASPVTETSNSDMVIHLDKRNSLDFVIPDFNFICDRYGGEYEGGQTKCTGPSSFRVTCIFDMAISPVEANCPTDYFCEDIDHDGNIKEEVPYTTVRCVYQDYKSLLTIKEGDSQATSPAYCLKKEKFKQFVARMEAYDAIKESAVLKFLRSIDNGRNWVAIDSKYGKKGHYTDHEWSYNLDQDFTCFKGMLEARGGGVSGMIRVGLITI